MAPFLGRSYHHTFLENRHPEVKKEAEIKKDTEIKISEEKMGY